MKSKSDTYHSGSSSVRMGRTHVFSGQKRAILMQFLVCVGMIALYTAPAQAGSMRTFVSGKGDDSNPCTAEAPCLTLQGALAQTIAGGEIYVLNSANYGYVAINQAVSIVAGSGVSGILAPSNVTGITITAGANDIVNLRGLDVDGAGTGANGIQFTSGAALNIQDSAIRGFTTGINFQPSGLSTLSVTSTLVSNNATGIMFQSAAANVGLLNDVQLINNGTGIDAVGTNSASPVNVTLQGSLVANNSAVGVLSGGYANVWISNSSIVNNGTGLEAQNPGALEKATGSYVSGNGTGWMTASGGQVISSGNNGIAGNSNGNNAPPTSAPPPPPPNNSLIDNLGHMLLDSNGHDLTTS